MKTLVAATVLAAALGCTSKEGEPVSTPPPALMAGVLPPIDAAAPAKVQRATFALG